MNYTYKQFLNHLGIDVPPFVHKEMNEYGEDIYIIYYCNAHDAINLPDMVKQYDKNNNPYDYLSHNLD